MKIFLDNVNINSNSGPNSFGKKLKSEFENLGHNVILDIFGKQEKPDVQLSFIATQFKVAPLVQRLDGIYFNSEQDFNSLNSPIESTYQYADAIIFQSDFNRDLIQYGNILGLPALVVIIGLIRFLLRRQITRRIYSSER